MTLTTERLLVRRFRPEDGAVLAAYRSDPEVARYQAWSAPVPPEQGALLAAEFAAGQADHPGWFQYALELRATGELVGDVAVNLHPNLMQAEIGYTVARAHQRRGYAGEACAALLDELLTARGLLRISAECDARNTASAKLLTKLGFHQEGLRRSHTWIKGEWTDDLLFGLLADDWRALRLARNGQAGHHQRSN